MRKRIILLAALAAVLVTVGSSAVAAPDVRGLLKRTGPRGLAVTLNDKGCEMALKLARQSELIVYVQLASAKDLPAAQAAAVRAKMYGTRIYVEAGKLSRIHLAENLADLVYAKSEAGVSLAEMRRVLRPGGTLVVADKIASKRPPAGMDEWTHPYHGPDNNPQTTDRIARWPYLTRFMGKPFYGAMPQVTVIAGGRIFKLFGHFTSKRREWPYLHKVIAINAYNGTVLWQRDLKKGFAIHRNTVVATDDTLYLADDTSCKLIDPATGKIKGEISPPASKVGGKCWKWMAIDNGVMYAMIGGPEMLNENVRGAHHGKGWGWGGMGKAYGGRNPDPTKYPWGFGRHIVAIDLDTKEVKWVHKEDELIDGRAIAMREGRIYYYCHEKHLVCLDVAKGDVVWKSTDERLLEAIGPHYKAQFAKTGFSSSVYMKAGDKALYFAGPQRTKLVAASTADGSLLWWKPDGNKQLVLRKEGLYAMGHGRARSQRYDPLTGKLLKAYKFSRVSCTRATGSIDSIFVRGQSTFRLDIASDQPRLITPMRPPCTDGVMIAHGLLYWGPWMCDCNNQLVGNIALGPAGDYKHATKAVPAERLERAPLRVNGAEPTMIKIQADDWPTYRKDSHRSSGTTVSVPAKVRPRWTFTPDISATATAPVTAAGMIFVGDSAGAVRAINAKTGNRVWKFLTGGAITFPPTIYKGYAYVGSADGWVYCLVAADGQLVWRFRAAPIQRKIPVYGKLYSNWPVASGVLVEDGVAYFAAGISNFDGTHVYALDAVTGEMKWQNNTSGNLNPANEGGVGVQGCLLLHKGKLHLAGGNNVSPAVYDAKTGKCSSKVPHLWAAGKWGFELFRGRDLYLTGDRVQASGQKLYSPVVDLDRPFPTPNWIMQSFAGDVLVARKYGRNGRKFRRLPAGTDPTQAEKQKVKPLWERHVFRKVHGVVVAGNAVLFLGHMIDKEDNITTVAVKAVNPADGKDLWQQVLPGPTVPWGIAVDAAGQIITTHRDGKVVCIGAAR